MAASANLILHRIGRALKDASRAMANAETPKDAAAISYFVLFTLSPSILVVMALVDSFLGWLNLHGWIIDRFAELFPGSRASLVMILSEISNPSAPILISCLVLLGWTSTWIFLFIENALNRAWGVPRRRTFWESRMRSAALMILGGLLLLLSSSLTALVSSARLRAGRQVGQLAGQSVLNWLWSVMILGSGFLVAILVFCLVYKLLPDRKVRWIEALSGAFLAAILWEIGSYCFGMLVPFFDYQRIYGRAGAIIALLTWIYSSSMILLYGANFSAGWHGKGNRNSLDSGHRSLEPSSRPALPFAKDPRVPPGIP